MDNQNHTLNEALEIQVEQRTGILNTVNEISAILLGSSVDTFEQSLHSCMDKLGESIGVDRVYIWNNHMEGDELYCTQLHEWSGTAEPQQGNELTVSVPFPPDWYPKLSQNKCVNGVVADFPDYERVHLEAQGIVSILVVPIFLYDTFWGFIGFDDCEKQRVFTDAEEAILRTAGLLFAHAWMRNELTADLVRAKEEALASARAKTDFLANMSHEIRTPINAITGMTGMAKRATEPGEVHKCLGHIETASQQLLAIVNDILDMSKIAADKMELVCEPFGLQAMLHNIQSIVAVQAAKKQQTFLVEGAETLPPVVVGDDLRLTQVLMNLLSNAMKFTNSGGTIRLRAQQTGTDEEGFVGLRFSVEDNGIGISPQQMTLLFAEFEQGDRSTSRMYGGTGLGLAISQNIARLMNGGIEVESEMGKGSRFTVDVRLLQGASDLPDAPLAQPTAPEHCHFEGKRVLLVEDIEINREIAKALLEEYGLVIEEAAGGREALAMFAAKPDYYDIIFMDIQMPGMDGYTATRELRKLSSKYARQIPIIAMTANAFADDVQQCLDAGMNGHVAKPIDDNALAEALAKFLG